MLTVLFGLLGLLFILYAVFVFMAQTGTLFFAVWIVFGLFFELLAWMTGRRLWGLIPRGLLGVAGLLVFAGFGLLICLSVQIAAHFHDHTDRDLDYLIVLGAYVTADGPSPVLRYRLVTAAEYLDSHPETKCIVSGAKGSNEPCTEAEAMEAWLTDAGISPDRIIKETRAVNTNQNIRYAKELMEEGSTAGIVTNDFHMYRALCIAAKQGLDDVEGISAGSTPAFLPNNVLRECLGLVKDYLAGNLELIP